MFSDQSESSIQQAHIINCNYISQYCCFETFSITHQIFNSLSIWFVPFFCWYLFLGLIVNIRFPMQENQVRLYSLPQQTPVQFPQYVHCLCIMCVFPLPLCRTRKWRRVRNATHHCIICNPSGTATHRPLGWRRASGFHGSTETEKHNVLYVRDNTYSLPLSHSKDNIMWQYMLSLRRQDSSVMLHFLPILPFILDQLSQIS